MTKTLLTPAELCQRLTAELQKIEGCEACLVVAVVRLKQQADDGCNWSDSVTLNTRGKSLAQIQPHLADVIRYARSEFNLSEQT